MNTSHVMSSSTTTTTTAKQWASHSVIVSQLATIITLLLAISATSSTTQALPTGTPSSVQTPTISAEAIREFHSGMFLMQDVMAHTLSDGINREDFDEEEELLAFNITCYMYNRYTEYSMLLSYTHPDEPSYANYSANQFMAQRMTNASCKFWNTAVWGETKDCSFSGISEMCSKYQLYQIIYQIRKPFEAYLMEHSYETQRSYSFWIERNLGSASPSASDVIRGIAGVQ